MSKQSLFEALDNKYDTRGKNGTQFKFKHFLLYIICAKLAGANSLRKQEEYLKENRRQLGQMFDLHWHKAPKKTTISDFIKSLDENYLSSLLCLFKQSSDTTVHVDGKTVCASGQNILNVFTEKTKQCVGQTKFAKGQEMTCVYNALKNGNFDPNTWVTLDAIHCQVKTFTEAKKKRVNLLVCVKDNNKNLKEELLSSFSYFNTKKRYQTVLEKSCFILKTYETLPINNRTVSLLENKKWKNFLKTAILVTRQNLTTNHIEHQLYITNKACSAKKSCDLITGHWHIENNLHQNLDRALQEDSDKSFLTAYKNAKLRAIALNLLHYNKVKNFTLTVYKNSLNIKNVLALKGLA